MRVESVRQGGDGTLVLGLVRTQSERFLSVPLTDSDINSLTVLDTGFSYDGDGPHLRPDSQGTCGGKAPTKDQVTQSMNKMVVKWTT